MSFVMRGMEAQSSLINVPHTHTYTQRKIHHFAIKNNVLACFGEVPSLWKSTIVMLNGLRYITDKINWCIYVCRKSRKIVYCHMCNTIQMKCCIGNEITNISQNRKIWHTKNGLAKHILRLRFKKHNGYKLTKQCIST